MKKIVIIPTPFGVYPIGIENYGNIPFSFLHGNLDDDCGYDKFVIDDPLSLGFEIEFGYTIKADKNKQGIYPAIYNGKDCTLFLWYINYKNLGMFKCLTVYNDDIKAYKYANKCFIDKKEFI